LKNFPSLYFYVIYCVVFREMTIKTLVMCKLTEEALDDLNRWAEELVIPMEPVAGVYKDFLWFKGKKVAGRQVREFYYLKPQCAPEYRRELKEACLKEILSYIISFGDKDERNKEFRKLTGEKPHYFEGHAIASANFYEALAIVAKKYDLKMVPVSFEPIAYNDTILRMHIDSMNPDYDPYVSLKKACLDKDEKYTEIFVAHPGYLDAYIIRVSSLTINRAKEAEMLCDRSMIEWVNSQNIEQITYDQL